MGEVTTTEAASMDVVSSLELARIGTAASMYVHGIFHLLTWKLPRASTQKTSIA